MELGNHVNRHRAVLVIDENVEYYHGHHLHNWNKIVVPSGEELKKIWLLVDEIIDGLDCFRSRPQNYAGRYWWRNAH